ncbi:MAG: hypothetical protein A2945_00495 [Candidatus Liptonbacteria bacterium RIFCSPLOWO2_01_FULL_52_25]|uniref:Phosphoheptose isomerase n=1 Tax=Candidatus Liptonbacteria bacterium RIFCSPLOWO2_01_FULL_52_25 TaxID=1798650 RepID=A0A1G2CG01_9BACT|nr:MAG: hypothetical protein A2945_00495 [Candidatus Liptonbacteria bacterium RIFCSPLOWO2_01_FULL_52_25]
MKNTVVNAFKRHQELVERSLAAVAPDVEKAGNILLAAIKTNNCMFTCGNGGSAADSQHFSGEFLCRYKDDRRPLKAMALTVDTSAMTAIGNDYHFDLVFARKVQALGDAGDVLVAFTTSGTSKNIVAAVKQAKTQGLKTIVFTGEGGNYLRSTADAVIAVPSKETARIQEVHQIIYHALCEHIDAMLPTIHTA